MPDAHDRIPPVSYSLTDEEWERIFGPDDEPELDTAEPEFGIVWDPDPSLDGATFIPE